MLATLLQMPQHVGPVETRSLIGWLVLGLLAGWLAGKISRANLGWSSKRVAPISAANAASRCKNGGKPFLDAAIFLPL